MKTAPAKERILEAGLTVFSARGYTGATTREISERAGVAEITLFRHFGTKERLFEEVIDRYSWIPELKGLPPELEQCTYREGLARMAGLFVGMMAERFELFKILHAEIHHSEKVREVLGGLMAEVFKGIASCFRVFKKRGELRNFNLEYAARAFWGMLISYFIMEEFLLTKAGVPLGKKQVIAEFVEIFITGTEKK